MVLGCWRIRSRRSYGTPCPASGSALSKLTRMNITTTGCTLAAPTKLLSGRVCSQHLGTLQISSCSCTSIVLTSTTKHSGPSAVWLSSLKQMIELVSACFREVPNQCFTLMTQSFSEEVELCSGTLTVQCTRLAV